MAWGITFKQTTAALMCPPITSVIRGHKLKTRALTFPTQYVGVLVLHIRLKNVLFLNVSALKKRITKVTVKVLW